MHQNANYPVPYVGSGAPVYPTTAEPWLPPSAPPEPPVRWERYFAAVRRYKWLILAVTLLGGAAGFTASRFIAPEYETYATLWLSDGAATNTAGPIRAQELLSGRSWRELLNSFTILDKVALQERLYLHLKNPADSLLFRNFGLAERVLPGDYRLHISSSTVALDNATGGRVSEGAVGDSVGQAVGIRWVPSIEPGAAARTVDFTVAQPRSAAVQLRRRLTIDLPENSSLLQVSLRGEDGVRVASTLNALTAEFVRTAAELKTRSLVETAKTLREQLDYAYSELRTAEMALENFRINTITLPSEGSAVAAGIEITRDPVFESFFEQKIELDNTRRDREAIERVLGDLARDSTTLNALWAIPAVDEYGQDLKIVLMDYANKDAALRAMRATYTDEHPAVREAARRLEQLRTVAIPPLVVALGAQLRERERALDSRISSASRELREIPSRTIEEMRLRRNVQTRDNLYTMLKNRYEEARLAEASSLADVSILDYAAAPQFPTRNTAPRVIAMALVASFGLAVLLALALDRFDRRFRYPEQATDELGLPILGAVPAFDPRRTAALDPEAAAQVVEAFRSIRMSAFHAAGATHPMTLTVTSPGIGDGKSLVSSNLALSFAEAGYATLLIDGDMRRGALHAMFGVDRRPGLVDFLEGSAHLDEVLRPATHDRLTLLPCGRHVRRAPELLSSAALPRLLGQLRSRFHVIIIDSPPLGAGVDAFALASATVNVLLVLRSGETDRNMARAKLELLQRLPVRLIGTVLNDIEAKGVYRYYSYLYGYTPTDGPEEAALLGR